MMDTVGLPCIANNVLGDCKTLDMAPGAYCSEGLCRRPPSFPGDNCFSDSDCTTGGKCVNHICVGVPEGGICTNQWRLCDRGLYCPNAPPGHSTCRKQKPVGGTCQQEFSFLGFLHGINSVNECEWGSHCVRGVCKRDSEVRAGLGENCTGHHIMGGVQRLCEPEFFCHTKNKVK